MDKNTLTQTADTAKEAYKDGREMLNQGLRTAKDYADTVSERSKEAMVKSKEAFVATQDWAKENPWMAMGMIAGVGLIAGLLIGTSRR